jgi:hypothetical protein
MERGGQAVPFDHDLGKTPHDLRRASGEHRPFGPLDVALEQHPLPRRLAVGVEYVGDRATARAVALRSDAHLSEMEPAVRLRRCHDRVVVHVDIDATLGDLMIPRHVTADPQAVGDGRRAWIDVVKHDVPAVPVAADAGERRPRHVHRTQQSQQLGRTGVPHGLLHALRVETAAGDGDREPGCVGRDLPQSPQLQLHLQVLLEDRLDAQNPPEHTDGRREQRAGESVHGRLIPAGVPPGCSPAAGGDPRLPILGIQEMDIAAWVDDRCWPD